MALIVFDGPEKAGKTTTITQLIAELNRAGLEAERFHWNKENTQPDDRAHSPVLQQHSRDAKVWVWDRAWPSEFVYGRLLNRNHRMRDDPWLGEWLHGRAVQTVGLRVILAGPRPDILTSRRDSSDHNISPDLEQALFTDYGERFGWTVIRMDRGTAGEYKQAVRRVMSEFLELPRPALLPPDWCGPWLAETVFIGEQVSGSFLPGGWLPFTSRLTTLLGRELKDQAFRAAWTNMNSCPPEQLWNRKTVITCSKIVHEWYLDTRKEKNSSQRVINITHPAYLYRYENKRTQGLRELTRIVLRALQPL